MKDKIGLGILGCSKIASKSMINNFIDTGLFEITAIASRELTKAQSYTNNFGGIPYQGYNRIVENPNIDCVYISLPTGLHYEWGKKCLEAGKHIFMEKTFCETYEQTQELVKIAKSKNLAIFENFMFQENDQYELVKNIIESKKLGKLNLMRTSFCFPLFDVGSNIRYSKKLGGGALLDAGAYILKGAQYLLGEEITIISANYSVSDQFGVDINGFLTLQANGGAICQGYYGFEDYYNNNIELYFTEGYLKIHRAFTSGIDFNHKVTILTNDKLEDLEIKSDNPGIKHCARFADHIMNNKENQRMYSEILTQSKLIDKIQKINNGSNDIN